MPPLSLFHFHLFQINRRCSRPTDSPNFQGKHFITMHDNNKNAPEKPGRLQNLQKRVDRFLQSIIYNTFFPSNWVIAII